MFDKSANFPEGWFFIKNSSNGYVLMVENESHETGSPIVLSTLRTKGYDSQLWRHDIEKGYLVNKKSGQVMDVHKGNAKAGVDIIQQIKSATATPAATNCQSFGLSPQGHIYLTNKSSLVLGIKESFFARREGLHVHLQLVDKKHLDRKEQRWDFVLPVVKAESVKRSIVSSSSNVNIPTPQVPAVAQIKEDDTRSVRSTNESICSNPDQDESAVRSGSFPETAFFLKSDAVGLYISLESPKSISPDCQLTLEAIRKRAYDSQLWIYDATTQRVTNKFSGLVLGIEGNAIKDGADLCQVISSPANDKTQAWFLSPENELTLKSDPSYVMGYKESWFGSREGAHLHLQKRTKGTNQKFSVVLPVFKKSETVKSETKTIFPTGWFFIKSQAHGLVLSVLETGVIAAEVAATTLDTSNYSRQLWKFDNGFIINKTSNMVLDVRGGEIKSGAGICQFTQKTTDAENQKWALTNDGAIYPTTNKNLILCVNENETIRSALYLTDKKASLSKAQRWNFVLPVFKKKQVSTVKKITTFRYAAYPSGWFFIRTMIAKSTTESPYVLTASDKSNSIDVCLLDRNEWQNQLWSFSSGKLINYGTDHSIDVSSTEYGAYLLQSTKSSQKWHMTTDGYLFYGSVESNMAVSVVADGENKYKLALAAHKHSQEFRWGFLIPKFSYRSGIQILSYWSIVTLKEYRKLITTTTQTTVSVAQWPEGEFYIRGQDGYALVPEKNESGASLTMRKLDAENHAAFKWTFKNYYLVHCATGLVMHVQDTLSEGAQLQLAAEQANNENQHWLLRIDGSIISKKDQSCGLNLVQVNGFWTVRITTTVYYAWRFLYGRYSYRYSEKEKREISYLVSFQRIVLSYWISRKNDTNCKLVKHSYGIFPKGWLFIRSKCDPNLFVTLSGSKKGAKLILSKLDFANYKRQLWRYRDDGCIVNFDTDYVIDVAGGKLLSGSDIIQWNAKFLRSSRKNQMWSLSVDGHIHPQSNTDLVLSSLGDHAIEGAELKLVKRGDNTQDYQQWSFASPVFKKCAHVTYSSQQANKSSLELEKIGESHTITSTIRERYETITKRTIIRRWAHFPDGKFFIRSVHGDKTLALTVERDEATLKYRVVIRSLSFNAYKWQLWCYRNGHIVNEETGLVLDAQRSQDDVIEGEQTQVYLKEGSVNEGQYWNLGVNGEIYLRSNEKLLLGPNRSAETTTEGSLVGINKCRMVRTNIDGKESYVVKSEEWLRWSICKPVFGQDNVTIERTEEHVLAITKTEEVVNDDEEDIFDEDIDEDDTNELEVQTPSSSTSVSTLGTRGVSVVTSGTVTTTEEKPAVQPKASTSNSSVKSSSSSKSRRSQHSFQLEDSYIPTGFEKIARYKTHHNGFPSGYFFIKSCLHGYVLDITGAVNEDSDVVLTRLKSTDFASQLWTYQKGFLVNLKGQSLVLDAARSNVKSGERAHLSQRSAPTENADDQVWEYSPEGHVHLKAKRSLVLSLKETRRSDKHDEIQVYVQEAKPLVKKEARLEQRWELLVPALIPLEQGPGGVKIIESGKVERTITTTVVTYSWLKELLRYRVSRENQWPTAQGWFYIRFGAENRYLASGETAESEVGLYEFDKSIDYKRYLWAYVDGYLINYRYLLRLVLTNTRTWTLSDSHSTLDQKFVISTNGLISVSVKKVIYYICYIRTSTSVYKLSATTDKSSKESQGLELQIPVISDEEYNKKCVKSYKDVHSWVRRQLTEKYTLTKTIRVGRFPASTWFFIKVDRDGKDDLVLASTSDSQLVLKKIDFKNFQSQLWTHKNGLLINYGSKLVIDIKDSIKSTSTVITSKEKESAIGQKWIITVDGLIQHEGNDKLVIGTESLKEGTSVLLTTTDKSHSVKYIIRWKFGIPSFGQYTITRKSTLKDVTKVIEDGAVIQGTKDITAVKKTANDLVRKEIKSYYTVIIETRLITRWWKTIFIHRLTSCRTQKEYLQVIEEYRRVLYTRLNQYFITYGSNLTEEQRVRFEKSVKDIKDIIEKEVFEKSTTYLKTLKSDDTVTVDKFDIAKITHISCELVEKKYKSILDAEKTTEKQVITKETFTKRTIVTTKTIQYIIRYWITTIQRRIIEQKKAGASKETIAKYMIEWKKELDEDLSKVEKSYDTTIIESTTVDEKTKDVSKKAFLAILEKSKSEIESTISLIDYASEEIVSETYWNRIVRQLVKRVCQHVDSQTTVTDESSESESEEESIDKDTFEFSQNETVTTLIETKQYISVWYKNLLKDITSTLEDKNADIKDVTVYIDTAEVDITSKIDEINEKIAILSHNLVNLNWKQRRYVISYINRLKINIIGSLTTFRTTVKEKDKKSLLDYSQVVFSEEVVQDICSETESVIDVINTTAKHTTTTTTYLTKDVSKHTDTIVSEDQNIVKRDTVEDKKQKAMDKTTVETVKDKKHTDEVTTVIAEKVTVVGTVEEKKPNNETTVVNEEVTTVTREVTEEKPKHEVTEVTVVETVKDKKPTDETTIVTEEVTTVTREITEDKPKHEVTEVTVVQTVKDKKPTDETTIVTEEVTTVTHEITEDKPKHEVTEVTVVETVKDKKPTDETTVVTEEVITVEVVEQPKTTTEVVSIVKTIDDTAEVVSRWFSRLTYKINTMIEVGECTEDIESVITKEQVKITEIIEESEKKLITEEGEKPESVVVIDDFHKHIKNTIKEQVKVIKTTVEESSTDNVVSKPIDFEVIETTLKETVTAYVTETKDVCDHKHITDITVVVEEKPKCTVDVIVREIKSETVVPVNPTITDRSVVTQSRSVTVVESIEEIRPKVEKFTTSVVDATQSKLDKWYDSFFCRIRTATAESGSTSNDDIKILIGEATEEVSLIISEAKKSIKFETYLSENVDKQTLVVVKSAEKDVKQSLNGILSIITQQIATVQNVVCSADINTVNDKVAAIEVQSRHRTQVALKSTKETTIVSSFEGKTVSWIETAKFPASFKDVKVFAFDLIDTAVDYRTSIRLAWLKIIRKKTRSKAVNSINIDKFIRRWYRIYVQVRTRSELHVNDSELLLSALRSTLIEYSIETEFSVVELDALCSAWFKLQLYEDSAASIRKVKKLEGMYAVSISHTFNIRTMMDLARSGCLCWHAQFTADMFAACSRVNGTNAAETVISKTATLLGLNNASELAIVSSNRELLEVAKLQGSKTVYIDRYSPIPSEAIEEHDIQFDALDTFAESFEAFHESNTISNKVEVPVTKTWFQRVVSTVADTAESVTDMIIG